MPLIGIFILNLLELSINLERSDSKSPLRERGFRGEVTLTYFHIMHDPPESNKFLM